MQKKVVCNHQIKGSQIRLILENGSKSVIMEKEKALAQAVEQDADLIQISNSGNLPVCKIMKLDKYLYMEKQKQKLQAKKSRSRQLKEIRITPSIGYNDLLTKAKTAQRILTEGDDLKLTLVMRGRELSYAEEHKKKLLELTDMLSEFGTVNKTGQMNGRQFSMIIRTKKS